MLLQISDILQPADCAAIRSALDAHSLWRDGKATAAGAARKAKSNMQADASNPAVRGVLAKIETALRDNAVFSAAAQPAKFARLIVNRYTTGMAYGDHVDAAYIEGVRADLSFTLFLNDPDDYGGGALCIDTAGHTDEIKLPAGSVVLYPSTSVHRVASVDRGERFAAVGWIKSRVQSAEARAVLFDLETTIAEASDSALRLRLNNIRNNLLRIFGK